MFEMVGRGGGDFLILTVKLQSTVNWMIRYEWIFTLSKCAQIFDIDAIKKMHYALYTQNVNIIGLRPGIEFKVFN